MDSMRGCFERTKTDIQMNEFDNSSLDVEKILVRLADKLISRTPKFEGNRKTSYVAKLLSEGPDSFLKKIGEESTELILAANSGEKKCIVSEMADLWFHCLVLLTYYDLRPEDIFSELARREGISGFLEKAQRNLNKSVK